MCCFIVGLVFIYCLSITKSEWFCLNVSFVFLSFIEKSIKQHKITLK